MGLPIGMQNNLTNDIWTEKYRPKLLKDVAGHQNIVKTLEKFVANKSLPHCLFTGPSGCGKTTSALAMVSELFGNQWKSNFLDLNASDERGIDTIRVKVKDFARTIPMTGLFKIIYLDEADALTKDAQHAMRRIMEDYSEICRFILACNYSSKIIPAIQSRTAIFRFSSLSSADSVSFLRRVSDSENLNVDDAALEKIHYISEGDMRRALNVLQIAALNYKTITEKNIMEVTAQADPQHVQSMVKLAIDGDFSAAREKLHSLFSEYGIAGEDIIKDIYSNVLRLDLPERKKLLLIEKIGEYEFRITEGSNAQIQLESLLAQLALMNTKPG